MTRTGAVCPAERADQHDRLASESLAGLGRGYPTQWAEGQVIPPGVGLSSRLLGGERPPMSTAQVSSPYWVGEHE